MGDSKKTNWQFSVVLLLFSFLIGGSMTSYLAGWEKHLFMPIRNLLIFGKLDIKKNTEDGVPISVYKSGEGINPVHVAQVVRAVSLKILETQSSLGSRISTVEINDVIKTADYFIKASEERRYGDLNFKVWTYNFDYPVYGLTSPWLSGMAQGHVIEVTLAAYKLTGEKKYLQTARLAANALAVPIEHGGVAVAVGEGLWFEEYAQNGIKPPYVLNGNNFALNGLWHLNQIDKNYNELYRKGLVALKLLLPQFDASLWSKYDLLKIPASIHYQNVHVDQLNELYKRTGDKQFLTYANKFQTQLYLPFSSFYRIFVYPSRFLVAIFILNVSIVFLLGLALNRISLKARR